MQLARLQNLWRSWMSKAWCQWLLATVFFFCFSWLYMGQAITQCTTATASLGSDSTGGMAWTQWVSGNDLSWERTTKSNYPIGEELNKPQYVTSTLFISTYKLLASLSTPICGINLIVLLGYLSCALTMFGLIRWLLKRADIALFAGYAAAFVPFHILKSQSHVNYLYGSIFIGLIWAFLWLISKPSYWRAVVFSIVASLGYYFDGYFILFSTLLISGLFGSYTFYEVVRLFIVKGDWSKKWKICFDRLKYLAVAGLGIGVLLIPIALVYKTSGKQISQSLSSVRSDIRLEASTYGARPIEFVTPAVNNALMPASYGRWRLSKLHGSNISESTLYLGYTIIIMALIAVVYVLRKLHRKIRFQGIPYQRIIFISVCSIAFCFAFSLPPTGYIFGSSVKLPTLLLVKYTANWRVLSRLFLVIHPLFILIASLGLYWVTRNKKVITRLLIVLTCFTLLFLEYLPHPINFSEDLYKDAPKIYKQLSRDDGVAVVAEYPLADFRYTPEIFTFQPIHNKILVNANDGGISRGPLDSSIAGLNDPQTISGLKALEVDEIITHGFKSDNPNLTNVFTNLNYKPNKLVNTLASSYAYKINPDVLPARTLLTIVKGYESLSVDEEQISHRAITNEATFDYYQLAKSQVSATYNVTFSINSLCEQPAQVAIQQDGRIVWKGEVGHDPMPIGLRLSSGSFTLKTKYCSVDITRMSAQAE